MYTYIALFRGINVGGRNSLSMKELASIFESLGGCNVRTYIQSGNVVFQSVRKTGSTLAKKIGTEVGNRHGFEPHVLVMGLSDIESAMKHNPFPEAEADPRSLHLGFLAAIPKSPDLKRLESLKKDSERFHLIDNIFYLHAPEGVGRSKLAASSETVLGVPMTDRNWNTVCRLKEMAMKSVFPLNKSEEARL